MTVESPTEVNVRRPELAVKGKVLSNSDTPEQAPWAQNDVGPLRSYVWKFELNVPKSRGPIPYG